MCTAINFMCNDMYFGRNLDVELTYGEKVTVVPRNYVLEFKYAPSVKRHYAIIGMAHINNSCPLFYDASNEYGLCIAALSFTDNARYSKPKKGFENVASFELIPYLLSGCKNVDEARGLLKNVCITDDSFSHDLPSTPLHWLISDCDKSIVAEPLESGLKIFENPVGVLTNNPDFSYHLKNLENYLSLSDKNPENFFLKNYSPKAFSHGMGAIGLPGDLSSASRFIRATFSKSKSLSGKNESGCVSQVFHILETVSQTLGCTRTENEMYEFTAYSSCINACKGIYYYRTYENSQICAIDMHKEDIDGKKIAAYPVIDTQHIYHQN